MKKNFVAIVLVVSIVSCTVNDKIQVFESPMHDYSQTMEKIFYDSLNIYEPKPYKADEILLYYGKNLPEKKFVSLKYIEITTGKGAYTYDIATFKKMAYNNGANGIINVETQRVQRTASTMFFIEKSSQLHYDAYIIKGISVRFLKDNPQ